MPTKSKRSSNRTQTSRTKTNATQRERGSPIDGDNTSKYEDEDDIEDSALQSSSGNSDTPSLNVKNLLKSLETKSKQNVIKKQTRTIQEIERTLKEDLMDRLTKLIESQESEFEEMVSGYFKFKSQVEDQKERLSQEIIRQHESLQKILSELEDNLRDRIEDFQNQSSLTIQQISQIIHQQKHQVHEHLRA